MDTELCSVPRKPCICITVAVLVVAGLVTGSVLLGMSFGKVDEGQVCLLLRTPPPPAYLLPSFSAGVLKLCQCRVVY